jgi:hypothetical protein
MGMVPSILTAEEHGALRILEEQERVRHRLHAQQTAEASLAARPKGGVDIGRAGASGGRMRAGSDDSNPEPTGRRQRGRPRLDTKDESAAEVSLPTPKEHGYSRLFPF